MIQIESNQSANGAVVYRIIIVEKEFDWEKKRAVDVHSVSEAMLAVDHYFSSRHTIPTRDCPLCKSNRVSDSGLVI
jgi:hypothetical protein